MPNVSVNSDQWSALSADAQGQISSIMGDLLKGGSISPDSSGASLTGDPPDKVMPQSSLDTGAVAMAASTGTDSCLDDCNTAENTAVAACALLAELGPEAVVACIIIARLAGNECRSDCRG
jgi:hypothetical protein